MEKLVNGVDALCISRFQKLQDIFAATTGVSAVLLSPEGVPVTQFSRLSSFYERLLQSESGKRLYWESVGALCAAPLPGGPAVAAACPHTGLLQAKRPLFGPDGTLAGLWVAGQVRDKDKHLDAYDAQMIQLAYETGVSSYHWKRLVCGLPEMSRQEFEEQVERLPALLQQSEAHDSLLLQKSG